ncbi:MAG: hypothetical protein ACOX0Q_00835 [Syntrophomonadaceae bacterium]|jgi:hypothetical protein
MTCKPIEAVKEQVIGIVPSYEETGDLTRILLEEGEHFWEKRSVGTIIKALARCYLVDLKEQKGRLQDFFQRRKLLPFYLSNSRVFIPVKVRKALIKNDACYGYINWRYVESITKQDSGGTVIKMRHNLVLNSLSSTTQLIQQLHMGRQLFDYLQQSSGENPSGEKLLLEAARLLAGSLDLLHIGLGKLGKNG